MFVCFYVCFYVCVASNISTISQTYNEVTTQNGKFSPEAIYHEAASDRNISAGRVIAPWSEGREFESTQH